MTQESHIREKAMTMLGSGTPPHIVASALGVTESAISQLLSQEEFSQQVVDLKYKTLTRQTEIDDQYLSLEELLLEKTRKILPLMTKPRDVVSCLVAINNTKRRGATNLGGNTGQSQVVNLTIPITIAHKFVSNVNNQVVEVHDESGSASTLVTASSGSLDGLFQRIVAGNSAPACIDHETSEALGSGSGEEVTREGYSESGLNQASNSGAVSLKDLL